MTAAAETTFGTAVLEGQSPAPYRLGTDTCSGQTVAAGGTCTVAVLAHPRDVGGHAARLRLPSASGDRVVGLTVVGVDTPGGAYTPLPPQRVLDTRKATGVTTTTPIGAAKSIDVQVTGRKGVPSTGVSAVVLNVTAIFPTKRGYLTVYPSTQSRPTASSVNFQAGWVGANLVTVPIAAGGKVRIYNAAGSTHVAADVVGYYHSAASTVDPSATALGLYESVGPVRFVDTRTAEWGKQPLNGQSYLWQSVDFGDEFNARVQALAVNVTVVKPTRQGHLTAFDGDSWTIPATSTLNFAAGRTVPNMAIIKAGHCSVECEAYGTPIRASASTTPPRARRTSSSTSSASTSRARWVTGAGASGRWPTPSASSTPAGPGPPGQPRRQPVARGRRADLGRRLQHDGGRHEHDGGAAEQHHGLHAVAQRRLGAPHGEQPQPVRGPGGRT